MQVIHQDKDKKSSSRRADTIDPLIYTEGIGRCVEEKYVGRFGRYYETLGH